MNRRSAIVIGAGIVGLATARALATRGYAVQVIERSQQAMGASVRNFGMIWPIGQPAGELYERALLSRQVWKEICADAKIWNEEAGSLHLAYHQDEWNVLEELAEIYRERKYILLDAPTTGKRSGAVRQNGLLGSLYSAEEIIVDPREAIANIPSWLTEKFNVRFHWGKAVIDISYPAVYVGRESFEADEIFVCSGADFETLYPELYDAIPITRCKLQMLRMGMQPDGWRMGPALCGGLSLAHYASFKAAGSLKELYKRFQHEYPDYLKWGIHVMAAQNGLGEITVGDSHEYGLAPDPFDRDEINNLIVKYLGSFAQFRNETITQTWHGVYPKLTNGQTEVLLRPESGVTIINGLGGAGMTLSFGLCEQVIARKDAVIIEMPQR